jgi:hypothetical protein
VGLDYATSQQASRKGDQQSTNQMSQQQGVPPGPLVGLPDKTSKSQMFIKDLSGR